MSIDINSDAPRKRARNEVDVIDIDKRPLHIRPHNSNPLEAPQILIPVCLLSRSQLPLAYLDTSSTDNGLFTSYVKILETCYDVGDGYNVMVAQDNDGGRLFAIERANPGRYALCKLAHWVQPHHISTRTAPYLNHDQIPRKRHELCKKTEEQPWWRSASIELSDVHEEHGVTGTLNICMNTVTASKPGLHSISQTISVQPSHDDGPASDPVGHLAENDPPTTALSAEDLLTELIKQYLDTLYLSRTSLAFFSKGPLSRARAAFSGDSTSEVQPTELIEFLRSILLSSATMDKKFREAIAETVSELADDSLSKSRKKRKLKLKRDKSGLFPGEKDYIESWWRKFDESGADRCSNEESPDALMKTRAIRLRNRESFIQVIFILEIMALEKTTAQHPPAKAATESGGNEHEDSQMVSGKKSRKKKVLDVNEMLHILLDRITIWYSVEMSSPSKTDQSGAAKDEANDELKNFCVEVILPFYMSRIPDHVILVNRKLGGPPLSTAVKRKHSSLSTKPGEPALRQAPGRLLKRPLERVASDIPRKSGTPPVLHRSATDSDALIKREPSDTAVLMNDIPSVRTKTSRVSAMQSISLNRREVDLSALHHANEEKRRKKAEIQEKLLEAIGGIKKPTRAMKDLADQTDESFAKAISKARSSGNRKPMEKQSQVTATPSHVKATPSHRRAQRPTVRRDNSGDVPVVPSSSKKSSSNMLAIPETGHRHRLSSPNDLLESPTTTRSEAIAIEQTPIRPLRLPQPSTPLILESPIKEKPINGGRGQKTIYDVWDNEEYEELA